MEQLVDLQEPRGQALPVVVGEEALQHRTAFDEKAEPIWKKLMPSGTVDVQRVYAQRGVADYIAKATPHSLSYEHLVLPDELKRG